MISAELKGIVDKFHEQGKMNFLPETSEEKITLFEKEKNIRLPEKYKEWLLFSDGGEFFLPAGIQLYGIEHKPLINIDNNDRSSDEYIVIGTLSSGDLFSVKKLVRKLSSIIKKLEESKMTKSMMILWLS